MIGINGKQIADDTVTPDRMVSSCAQTQQATWYVDGQDTTGHASDANDGLTAATPLLTDAERARRVAYLVVPQTTTVNLLSDLQATDHITEPLASLNTTFTVDGSQGAIAVHSGTLASYSAQAGNSPATVTDGATDWSTAGPGGTSLVGYRLRVTDGPNVGAICWIMHDNGAGVAVVTDPEILSTDPSQLVLVQTPLSAGDVYVVEKLPFIPSILTPYAGAGDGYNVSSIVTRFMYASISLDGGQFSVDAAPNDNYQRQFIGSSMGAIITGSVCSACLWNLVAGGILYMQSGNAMYMVGCGVLGDGVPATYFTVGRGASLTLDQGTLLYDMQLQISGWVGIGADESGEFQGGNAGVVSVGGSDAVQVHPGGVLVALELLWGSGSTGFGMHVFSCGMCVYTTKPSVTGTAGDLSVGGTTGTWAGTSHIINANNNATLAALA